jgi:hypothetical protein
MMGQHATISQLADIRLAGNTGARNLEKPMNRDDLRTLKLMMADGYLAARHHGMRLQEVYYAARMAEIDLAMAERDARTAAAPRVWGE